MKSRKVKKGFFVLLAFIPLLVYGLWPLTGKKWPIKWDEQKIQYKKNFLSQKCQNQDSVVKPNIILINKITFKVMNADDWILYCYRFDKLISIKSIVFVNLNCRGITSCYQSNTIVWNLQRYQVFWDLEFGSLSYSRIIPAIYCPCCILCPISEMFLIFWKGNRVV